VLFSISEYEKVSDILEAIETLNDVDLAAVLGFIQKKKIEAIIPSDFGTSLRL
jgi:hypothetical protein